MRVVSQLKINREEFNRSYLSYDDQKNIIQSDMSIAFAKELLKNEGLLESRNVSIDNITYTIFEIQAIVLSMDFFNNMIEYLSLHLSPDAMINFKDTLINKL